MLLQLEANHCFLLTTASRKNWATLRVCRAPCTLSIMVGTVGPRRNWGIWADYCHSEPTGVFWAKNWNPNCDNQGADYVVYSLSNAF